MRAAIDYCPFCCFSHIIGEHPRDGETDAQYWRRVNIGPRNKYTTMKHPTRSRKPQEVQHGQMITNHGARKHEPIKT